MGVTFAGLALFDSGPHRLAVRAAGRVWLPPFAIDELQTTIYVGPAILELAIIQTGRLVADADAQLWTLFDAIRSRAEAKQKATLAEPSGRSWPDMTILRISPDGPLDRGRKVSMGYRIDYAKLV